MRGLCPVQLQPGYTADLVHGVGQVNHVVFAIRLEALVVGGSRAQEEVTPPQRAQVEIELALRVDE